MDKPSPPAPVDYTGAANAQGQGNINTAIANKILGNTTQNTPYGSISYSQQGSTTIPGTGRPATQGTWVPGYTVAGTGSGGVQDRNQGGSSGGQYVPGHYEGGSPAVAGTPDTTVPNFTSNITLTPEVQKLVDADLASRGGLASLTADATGRVGQSLSKPFDLSSLPSDYNKQIADAIFARSKSYLDPQWAQNEEAERTRLANQGFSNTGDPNSGFSKAIGDFNRNRTQAYESASGAAIDKGMQAGNAERQQAIQELLLQRQQPLTELNALRTGAAPTLPTFTNGGPANAEAPPIFGAAQNQSNYLANLYGANVGQYNSQLSGLAGLGGAAIIAASDRRLKRDIRKVGDDPRGFGIYRFRYLDHDQEYLGCMADEVQKIIPAAVHTRDDGMLMLNYGAL